MADYPFLTVRLMPAVGTTSPIVFTTDPAQVGVRDSTLYVLDPEPDARGITPARREAILEAARAAKAQSRYQMCVEFGRKDIVFV